MSPAPTPAFARVLEHLELEAQIGGYEAAETVEPELASVAGSVARLLGADSAEVTITESATAAWEWALWAMAETFGWGANDRILLDRFAYGTMDGSLRRLSLAQDVELVEVGSLPDGSVDPSEVAASLDERVRLVLVTHMPTHLGTVADAEEVGRVLAGTGAIYALDIAQTVGQMPVEVRDIGCDVAFAPARKFLRGPRGTAFLYVRQAIADQLIPLTPSFGTEFDEDANRFELAAGLRRFDQYESAIAQRLGLGLAARYAMQVGLDRIADAVGARSREVSELLSGFDDVHLAGSPDSSGIVSFVHARLEPTDIRARLASDGVNVWVNTALGTPRHDRADPLPSVRVSPHYVTTDDEVAQLHAALTRL